MITRDLSQIAELLRGHGDGDLTLTPNHMRSLASRLEALTEQIAGTTVFTPNVVDLRRVFGVVEGGRK